MLRSLFAVLAVLVVGLAFLFGRPWLYIATGAILAGALGLLGWWVWTTYLAEKPERPRPQPAPDASGSSIDEFGIVDIQPEGTEPSVPSSDEDASPEASAAPEKSSPEKSSPASSGPSSSGPNASPATRPPPTARDTSDNRPASSEEPEETTVFSPLLEALRAALDARTVALLVQEEVALTYRIEALASTHDAVRQSGAFDTQAPLVTATMSRESVTLRPLAETQVAVEDLGYYASPPAVAHLAVAPVPQPDSSATTFLLADAPAAADLGTARARTLLKHFSDTIALLYDTDRRPPADDASPDGPSSDGPSSDSISSSANNPSSGDPSANDPGAPSDTPRPRRELIAEEMSAAQSTDDDLSLALVHLNRAESIARRGEEAVTSAERLFQARLDQMAPGQRIERFGELTYGVFFHEGTETVEPWVTDLESTMAQEQGELEGGVSVGVAVWDEETPEALRSEATKALREAYETGTSTIVT